MAVVVSVQRPTTVPAEALVGAPAIAAIEPIQFTTREARRQHLPDGSLVDMNAGARVEVADSVGRHDVRLLDGEVHFTVVHRSVPSLVVQAGPMRVRAVGPAFNVRLAADQIEVLVTHGRVAVDSHDMAPYPDADPFAIGEGSLLSAGERAVVSLITERPQTVVALVPMAEVQAEMAWQPQVLEFTATPLAEVVGVFNGGNSRQLKIGAASLGEMRIEGTFRLNNVDVFVRLMSAAYGLRMETNEEGVTVLRAP